MQFTATEDRRQQKFKQVDFLFRVQKLEQGLIAQMGTGYGAVLNYKSRKEKRVSSARGVTKRKERWTSKNLYVREEERWRWNNWKGTEEKGGEENIK